MRRLTAFAALAAATGLGMPAAAQTPLPPIEIQAGPEHGVVPAEVKVWLTSLGGNVADPAPVEGGFMVQVQDSSQPWSLNLYGCRTRCDDIQYNAIFTGAISEAQVSAWNREKRYIKAIWIAPSQPGGNAVVLAQYDVLLLADGAEQLHEPTYLWTQLLTEFRRALSAGVAPAQPPAAPPSGQ